MSLEHAEIRSGRPEVLFKKMVLKILQNSQETTCAGDSFK